MQISFPGSGVTQLSAPKMPAKVWRAKKEKAKAKAQS